MIVRQICCGPPANESELKAFEHIKSRLQSTPGEGEWVLLTNLAFSVNHQVQADEIDIVVIGPPGVKVLEVKHWTSQWVDSQADMVQHETDRVTMKARRIGTTLKKEFLTLPYVEGIILLTREPSDVKQSAHKTVRGVDLYTLNEWKEAIGFHSPKVLSNQDVHRLSSILERRSIVAMEGSLRRLAGYVNLELLTPKEQGFHRVYRGIHSTRQDRIVLHLYDISATNDKNAERKARREFEVLHLLQRYHWAPRIMDSFQDAPDYAGEMFFFTVLDPAAPTIDQRATDNSWKSIDRVMFVRNAVIALKELHNATIETSPIIHRNLTPVTILVRHDNTPVLTGFQLAKIPSDISVASASTQGGKWEAFIAPEVRKEGMVAADRRSDVYSLCASLAALFKKLSDDLSLKAMDVLQYGMVEKPQDRRTLEELETSLSIILGESVPLPAPPPARFWSEDQMVPFRDHLYRIIARLGSGGVGTTYKVVETDRSTNEDLGTYVAKVVYSKDLGEKVLKAYNLARSHLGRHPGLSVIYEVAKEWEENDFIALMTWVEGTPLEDFKGVFPLLAEDQQENSPESLALRWLRNACEGLEVLHRNGLVHGDVSPRNLIISNGDVVLTDFDFIGKIGEPLSAPGTMLYCSTSYQQGYPASPADDIFALSASFFHTIYEKEPFEYGGVQAKDRGLNWEGLSRDEYPVLAAFLDRATHPKLEQRFSSASEAISALRLPLPQESTESSETISILERPSADNEAPQLIELREERVDWLLHLLEAYPGSRWGNKETRGLDSEFSAQTYVETQLEKKLLEDVQERNIRLVILCGNAGDGKTALLQHLAMHLGLGTYKSSERILQGELANGLVVRMNLDGSAAWQGRSADEILEEFLKPFELGAPNEDIVHLLAVNDGRLLEYIETVESRAGGEPTPLTDELYASLQGEGAAQSSHIRFISLNQRSLVGSIASDQRSIEVDFLERLLDCLYGGELAANIWKPCLTCSAQTRCEVFRALKVFGPDTAPAKAPDDARQRARKRLFEALQAVHLRGEVHITTRELRATLIYILFGIHFCTDYHAEGGIRPLTYWDLTFSPLSLRRQGEVLRELARFDPALESHPQIDRYLVSESRLETSESAPRYGQPLESARRRAYFEWTENHIVEVAKHPEALELARGRHLSLFRSLPLENEEMNADKRQDLCARLCQGISRLEDLPPPALERKGVVPLRIMPRTPTETAFWVEKPIGDFYLKAELTPEAEGVHRLHRKAFLVYRYRDGREERLSLGAELFHLLLELGEGYQLGDVSTDDTFAHLAIFVQRLIQEDERELLAWNPMKEETIFRILARIDHNPERTVQKMALIPLDESTRV